MKIEDYNKYYIQGSDHYLIPKDEFKELFNEMINWKEESQKQKEVIDNINQYIKDNSYKIEWGDELQDDESLNINDDLTDEEFIMGLLDILKEVSK